MMNDNQITNLITGLVNREIPPMIEKMVKKKLAHAITPALEKIVTSSLMEAFQEALNSSLETNVVPTFKLSLKAMFEQVVASFEKDAMNLVSSLTQTLSGEFDEGGGKLAAGVNSNGFNDKTKELAMRQLAWDIYPDTPIKLAWMTHVALIIIPTDPTIAMLVPPIFEEVYEILSHHRTLPTFGIGEVTIIWVFMHLINSILNSLSNP